MTIETYTPFQTGYYDSSTASWIDESTSIVLGEAGGILGHAGFQFDFTVTAVPQGATINTATLGINQAAFTGFENAVNVTIYGYDSTDPQLYDNTNNPTTVPRTSASVSYVYNPSTTPALEEYDVSAIIQELVNVGGYDPGTNSVIAFAFVATATTPDGLQVLGGDDAQLEIDYTTGGGGGNVKTWNNITYASTKTINNIASASIKTWNGINTQ